MKESRVLAAVCIWFTIAQLALANTADIAELERLCDDFEQVRAKLDVQAARSLVWDDALTFHADGREPHNLLAMMATLADRAKGNGIGETVRVVHRRLAVHGPVAIAYELIGAAPQIAAGEKLSPRRRSVTWSKRNGDWKVAGLHVSPYSPWEKSIAAFEEIDDDSAPTPGGVVFVGSSSIRGWKTLTEDFPDTNVIGRGFGGSQLIDSILYAHRIVTNYQPRAVVVYAGDNDVARGKSAERVFGDFKKLVETIHGADDGVRIGFIAIKPSIARWDMWPTMLRANHLVAQFAEAHERVTYFDIATPMLGADGKPRPELFVRDGLHMTRSGYAVWKEVIAPWVRE